MKILFLAIILVLMISPMAFAQNLTVSLNQSTYYFMMGEEAKVVLSINNTYDKQIGGMLTYTVNQEISQGGFQYASTNSQSTTFSVNKGENMALLNFGTTDSPATLKASLVFSYAENGDKEVRIDGLTIIFVDNPSQANNQQNQMQSSSQAANQQQSQGQSQQQQGQQPQSQQTEAQQRLQNSQMSQDSAAMKQQMEKQIQQQQQMKDEFQNQVEQNKEFQNLSQQLQQQGYNPTNTTLSPTSNNSGKFQYNYQNKKGEQLTVQGEMQNSEMKSLETYSQQEQQKMLDQLSQNDSFQNLEKQLLQEGFNKTTTEFSRQGNNTQAKISYQDKNNNTVTIEAEFQNNTLKRVEIKKNDPFFFLWPVIFIIILIIIFWLYKKRKIPIANLQEEIFDHREEAKRLLGEAKELFTKKEYKEAYGKAGQAMRLYLAYENGLRKEMTSDEILKALQAKRKGTKELKECFDLCNLVQFAKYEANETDFNKIIKIAEKTIGI